MIAFVTKTDLDNYKYVADSVKNSTSWPQFVSEAQLLDIKRQISDGLFIELTAQLSTLPTTVSAANKKLLDGGTYTYLSRDYVFQGLKAAIIYYAFGRFTNRTSFNYTAAGIVLKNSDYSTPASDKHIQRLETESRLTADAIMCEVITFLNRNKADYPLWANSSYGCGSYCSDNRPFKVVGD